MIRMKVLAAAIGLTLGVSAEVWAQQDATGENFSVNVALDASSATAAGGGPNAAANGDGVATATDASATGGGDVAYAQDAGAATIDKSDNSAQESSDHSVANHDGTVDFTNNEVNLSGEVTAVTVTQTAGPVAIGLGWVASNAMVGSANGAAGMVQISQNLGHASLIQQNANVFGTVNVGN